MRGERQLLRLGEYLVARACQRLPRDTREERCREWAAELPAILHDPQVRFAPWRAVRMLGYAADTLRGAAKTPGRTPGPIARPGPVVALPFLVIGLAGLAAGIRAIVQEPGGRAELSAADLESPFRGLFPQPPCPRARAHDRAACVRLRPGA